MDAYDSKLRRVWDLGTSKIRRRREYLFLE